MCDWETVDWKQRDRQIAEELGCTSQAVNAQRKRLGKAQPPGPPSAKAKVLRVWRANMSLSKVAELAGCSEGHVRRTLRDAGKPYLNPRQGFTVAEMRQRDAVCRWLEDRKGHSPKVARDIFSRCRRVGKVLGVELGRRLRTNAGLDKLIEEVREAQDVLLWPGSCRASLGAYVHALRRYREYLCRERGRLR